MTLRARSELVALERKSVTSDNFNEEVETWTELGKEWADIFYGTGSERRQAAREVSNQSATFEMHSNTQTRSLTTEDRISFEGVWDIKGIAPDTPRRGTIAITALRGD